MNKVTQKHEGKVLSYDPHTHKGLIELNSGVQVPLHSTLFYSGRITRQPRIGEPVMVAIQGEPEKAVLKDIHGVWTKP